MVNDSEGGGKGGGISEEVMSLGERRARLSKIARNEAYGRQFRVGDSLNAVDLLNKMDNLYKQQVEVTHEVIHTFTFMLPDGTKFKPSLDKGRVIEGEVKELPTGEH